MVSLRLRQWIAWVSTFMLVSLAVTFSYIFLLAFIHGGRVTVDIDKYGEAEFEFVLIFGILWPLIIYGTYWTLQFQDRESVLE